MVGHHATHRPGFLLRYRTPERLANPQQLVCLVACREAWSHSQISAPRTIVCAPALAVMAGASFFSTHQKPPHTEDHRPRQPTRTHPHQPATHTRGRPTGAHAAFTGAGSGLPSAKVRLPSYGVSCPHDLIHLRNHCSASVCACTTSVFSRLAMFAP